MDQLTSSSRTSDKKTSRHLLSWWFQPIRKNMLVKLDHFCKDWGEMVRSIKTIRVATGTSLIQSRGYPRDFVPPYPPLSSLPLQLVRPFSVFLRSSKWTRSLWSEICSLRSETSDQTSLGCLLLLYSWHFSKMQTR